MSYLTLSTFKDRTLMPSTDVDALEAGHPGWVDTQLSDWSAHIDSRLSKRYAAPFSDPPPVAVLGWLTRIVTVRCYLKRGVNPTDRQYETIEQDATDAHAEIKEAADAELGMFELPLRSDTTANGVTRGGPQAYSEASPYVGFDVQSDAGRDEDSNRGGSYG